MITEEYTEHASNTIEGYTEKMLKLQREWRAVAKQMAEYVDGMGYTSTDIDAIESLSYEVIDGQETEEGMNAQLLDAHIDRVRKDQEDAEIDRYFEMEES